MIIAVSKSLAKESLEEAPRYAFSVSPVGKFRPDVVQFGLMILGG